MASAATKNLGFFKRAWHEMPDMVGSFFVAVTGLSIIAFNNWYYYKHDLDNRKYKFRYTVVRHDDPRAAKIRKD